MFFGCDDSGNEQIAPQVITNFSVTPINGGGKISYTIPEERGILYVMAEYYRGGELYTERSSIYKNYLTVEGFSSTDEVQVTLYTVDRDENKSEPVVVKFAPLEAPIHLIKNSLRMVTDFGGITAFWENLTGAEIGVKLFATDERGELKENQIYYSYVVNEEHTFRGFSDEERTFAISFEDKWGNASDTTFLTTIPYFETEAGKPFAQINYIPYDNNSVYGGTFPFTKMFDGQKGYDNGYLTKSGSAGNSFTIDLKQEIKLSRAVLWHRWKSPVESWIFSSVNVLSYEMWGTKEIDNDKLSDTDYWKDDLGVDEEGNPIVRNTFKDDWTYLGKHYITQPDAGEGSQADANLAAAIQGFESRIPIDAEPVRYIRLFVRSTGNSAGGPPVNNYYQISELSFFGNNQLSSN
jgi:hypothetical protein